MVPAGYYLAVMLDGGARGLMQAVVLGAVLAAGGLFVRFQRVTARRLGRA